MDIAVRKARIFFPEMSHNVPSSRIRLFWLLAFVLVVGIVGLEGIHVPSLGKEQVLAYLGGSDVFAFPRANRVGRLAVPESPANVRANATKVNCDYASLGSRLALTTAGLVHKEYLWLRCDEIRPETDGKVSDTTSGPFVLTADWSGGSIRSLQAPIWGEAEGDYLKLFPPTVLLRIRKELSPKPVASG